MTIARKIISNTAWQIISRVVVALLGIISIKFITNYLSTSTYGEYSVIYDYTAIFAIVADFGFFTIAVREMAKDEKKIPYILGNILSLRMIFAITALMLAVVTAFLIPKYEGTKIPFGIAIVSISTFMMFFSGTISSVLQVHLKMQLAAFAVAFGKIVTVSYIIATVLYFYPNDPVAGFPHLLYAWIIGNFFTILITIPAVNRLAKISLRFDFWFWKRIISETLPYGIALMLSSLYFRTGTVLMSFFGFKHDIGIYSVAMRVAEISMLIPAYFMNSILPILTRSTQENAREKILKILQYSFDFMALFSIPFFFGGFVLRKPVIAAISSDAFLGKGALLGSDFVLAVLLFGLIFTFFHYIFGYTLIALHKQKKLLVVNFFAAVLNIGLNLFFIPLYSFRAVSLIAVLTEIFIFIANFILIFYFIKFKPSLRILEKAVIASLVMAVLVYFIDPLLRAAIALKSIFITIPFGGLVYFGVLLLMKTFPKEMLDLIKKPKIEEVPPPN